MSIGWPPPNAKAPDPPSRRSLISRISCSRSASRRANSSSVILPISRCISASSSRCSAESSFSSASATAIALSSAQRMPPISRLSRMNMSARSVLAGALQFEADVDEIVRRPRPRVLEGQLVEVRRDVLDAPVERLFLVTLHQERGVHNHLVADRAVDAGRDRHVAKALEEFGDVSLGTRLQRRIDQAPVLHPREVGRALL